MIDKLVLIVLLVICAMLFAFAFLFAYVISRFYKAEEKRPPAKKLTEQDEITRREAQRLRKEVINMLTYNGDPQEEIHIDQVLMAHSH